MTTYIQQPPISFASPEIGSHAGFKLNAADIKKNERLAEQKKRTDKGLVRRTKRAGAPVALAPAPDELKLSEVEKRIVLAHRKLDRETQADLMHVMQAWANDPRFCAKAHPSLRLITGGAS